MGKVMCLDTSEIKAVDEVQKQIPLEEYLKNRTAFYDMQELKEKNADKHLVFPLTFSVSVRSAGNEVVYFNDTKSKRKLFYHSMTDVEKLIHEGYDLVMFMGSLSVQSMIEENEDLQGVLSDIMFNGSLFSVQGLYFNGFVNPVVYSTITILEEYFDKFRECLGKYWGVMTLEEMHKNEYGNIRALLKELKEVE